MDKTKALKHLDDILNSLLAFEKEVKEFPGADNFLHALNCEIIQDEVAELKAWVDEC
jgi:hypothetical protein